MVIAFHPQRVLEAEGLVLEQYWDDWFDYRDGLRDKKELFKKEVKKIKIKKARKAKHDSLKSEKRDYLP